MYNQGDIVTLAFSEERYLLAKIVRIEKLTLHDLTHLVIYDIFVEGGPGGYDAQGEYRNRTHVLPDLSSVPIIVDHIAVTASAFEESDPLIVDHQEVTAEELQGYVLWVALRRERAERRGMIRYDTGEEDENDDETWDDDEFDDNELIDDATDDESDTLEDESIESDEDEGDLSEDEEAGSEMVEVRTHTWHDTVFDIAIGQILVELADIFKQDEFKESLLAPALLDRVEANSEEINSLVRQLVDNGDYAAGQELLMYGDAAADALAPELSKATELPTVEDLLQILGDLGSDKAYGVIAEFFEGRIGDIPDDPIAVAAARSFCYVVMLTGGTPDPLHDRLKLIEQLDYPDLRDDAESAIGAIHSQGVEFDQPKEQSSDPFGGL